METTTGTIYDKLLLVQASVPKIEKGTTNKFYGSKYASLPEVLSVILPLLKTHGLLLINTFQHLAGQSYICTKILDVDSDTFVQNDVPLLGLSDMQKLGSAITYAQRYGLLPLLGLTADIDDDGNAASERAANTSEKIAQKSEKQTSEFNTESLRKLYDANKGVYDEKAQAKVEKHFANNDVEKLKLVAIDLEKRLQK